MRIAALVTCLALSVAGPAHAVERIKLGTLAPRGSTWEMLLKEMGQSWAKASGGAVRLMVYPGGEMGDEGDMIRKTRIGELQAVAVTNVGLHDIAAEPQAIDVPMMIDSYPMLDHVMQQMTPELERALDAKGYVVLGWSEVGFVRFFSTRPYASMVDFSRRAKMYSWDGDPASIAAWRAGGFRPVVVSATDITPSLQTGLIDTAALPPLYALTSHIFEKAKYMLDLRWAILTGAMVVRKDAWERVPPALRPQLLAISHDYARKIALAVRQMDADALTTMKAQGLQVIEPADRAAFRQAAIATRAAIRGKVVPASTFDEVRRTVAGSPQAAR